LDRQRDGRSLSADLDMTRQSSHNFADEMGTSDDHVSTAVAATSVTDTPGLAAEREDDDDELSYDEQDSVGERSSK